MTMINKLAPKLRPDGLMLCVNVVKKFCIHWSIITATLTKRIPKIRRKIAYKYCKKEAISLSYVKLIIQPLEIAVMSSYSQAY